MSASAADPGNLEVACYAPGRPCDGYGEYVLREAGSASRAYVAWMTAGGGLTILAAPPSGPFPRSPDDGEPLTGPVIMSSARKAIGKYNSLKPDRGKDPLTVTVQEDLPGGRRYTVATADGTRVLYHAGYYGDWPWSDWPWVRAIGGGLEYDPKSVAVPESDLTTGGDSELAARVHSAIGRHIYRDRLQEIRAS